MTPAETGRAGEALAADFLIARGMRVVDRNVRAGREEVDLVCFEPAGPGEPGGTVVVVEVKARRGTGFGAPEAAVDAAKQRAIVRVAEAYLDGHALMPASVRFDVVAVTFGRGAPRVEHFVNAFGHLI